MQKRHVGDLAVLGGPACFPEKLHVGCPNIGDRARLAERFEDLLDRKWLTNNGPYLQEFESRLAGRLGVRHCVAMNNATIALQLAIRALDMTGEVVVPSLTFVASAHALEWEGVTPIFCDVDPATHNLDPGLVERCVTPRTTGILAVHLWGRPCDVDGLAAVAARHNLRLLFDAAHAIGCSHQGRMIGGFGDGEVFSFHSTKVLNSFEGGALTTNHDELAERARLMRNFGFAGYDNVVGLGTNAKMSEVCAAMGLTSLEAFDDFVAVNRDNYRRYAAGLAGVPGVRLCAYDPGERNNYQYVVCEVDEAEAGLSRNELVDVLWGENVIARRYFFPGCHRMEPYRSRFPSARVRLPVTEALAGRLLALPTGTNVTEAAVAQICAVIRLALANGQALRAALESKTRRQAA
jgi:dTDP-4-amino-4,6-dideoxygalactose transaminase